MATENPAQPKIGILYPPTQEEIKAANSGAYASKGFAKRVMDFMKRVPAPVKIGGAVAGIAGLGAVVHEIVGAQEVPSIFRNSDDRGVLGNNNIQLVTLPEFQNQHLQQVVAEGKRITILNPFQLPEGVSASYVKSLSDRLPTEELRQQAEKDGIKDSTDFILPKDTTIIASMDARILLAKGRVSVNEDPNMSSMMWIYYYDDKQDVTYQFWFFTVDSSGLLPLVEMQEFTPETARGTNWQNLPIMQQGFQIVKTTKDNQQLRLNVKGYRGKVVGPQAEIVDKTAFFPNVNFFTNEAGEKALGLKN